MDMEEQDERDMIGRNKHSYFLRAKMPRFMGFQVDDDDDRRATSSSSICKSFLSSRGSKASTEDCSIIPSEEVDLAKCLVMLSNNKSSNDHNNEKEIAMEKGMFQCKACKKVFNSHQALGGHRASHKKVKGCFASKLDGLNEDDEEEEINAAGEEEPAPTNSAEFDATRKRVKMHECSVCRRVFSSGQALGGHKRCHWLTSTSADNAFIPSFQYHDHHHHAQHLCNNPAMLIGKHDESRQLDLNLNLPPPPPPQHDHDINKTSTRLCLHQWTNHKIDKEVNERNSENGCGMKLRKLSDLRDVNMDGGWLQMGIASDTTQMR